MPVTPYVSIVIAARNDNYGGNFLERLQTFLNVLIPLASEYSMRAELIVVEWNPPKDKPRLSDVLEWPPHGNTISLRFIEVPTTVHARMANSERLPMFDCYAKNVGIRRAKGSHILVTNPDILFSEALIADLAAGKLSSERFYRTDRYDFRGPVPRGLAAREALDHALRNLCRVNLREGKRRSSTLTIGRRRKLCGQLFGTWPNSYRRYQTPLRTVQTVVSFDDDNGIYGGLHTNASGDFLLASTESWSRIRGFPEFTDTFTHLDSYGCHQLKALGLEQALFLPPCMIFHWDHGRDEQKSRPTTSTEKWQSDLRKIRTGELGPAINGEDWGLVRENLPESLI